MSDHDEGCIPGECVERAKRIALKFKNELDYDDEDYPQCLLEQSAAFLAFAALINYPLEKCIESFVSSAPCIQHFEQAKYEIRRFVVENR